MPKYVHAEQQQTFCAPSAAIKCEIRADEISSNGHTPHTNKRTNKRDTHGEASTHAWEKKTKKEKSSQTDESQLSYSNSAHIAAL